MKAKLMLITFGKGGSMEYLLDPRYSSSRCEGHASPETYCEAYHWWADPPDVFKHHWDGYEVPAEGVPVLDLLPALRTKAGLEWVYLGPLCDVRLADGEIDRCPQASEVLTGALTGAYKDLYTLQQACKDRVYGPLDSVDVGTFVHEWRKRGARYGEFTVEDGVGSIKWYPPYREFDDIDDEIPCIGPSERVSEGKVDSQGRP